MNLALPALVTLLALLPGIVFLRANMGGKFSRRLVQLSTLGEIALYIVPAIPLDALAISFMDAHPTRAYLAFGVLTGDVRTSAAQEGFRDLMTGGLHAFWEYFLVLIPAGH